MRAEISEELKEKSVFYSAKVCETKMKHQESRKAGKPESGKAGKRESERVAKVEKMRMDFIDRFVFEKSFTRKINFNTQSGVSDLF